MAKAKHILDQVIERNPLFARNARQRIDRNGNLIGDGSFHSLYDVFDIPNVRHEVRPSIGSESVYVKYVGDDNYENTAVVRYSRHDNNGTRFGSEIDGRFVGDKVLKLKPGYSKKFEKHNTYSVDLNQLSPEDAYAVPNWFDYEISMDEANTFKKRKNIK